MMALAVGNAEQEAKVTAHQPVERKVASVNRGFAASGQQ